MLFVGIGHEKQAILRAAGDGLFSFTSGPDRARDLVDFPVSGRVILIETSAVEGDWGAALASARAVAPFSAAIAVCADRDAPGRGWDEVLDDADLASGPTLRRLLMCFAALGRALARTELWALRDPLTGVLNRRGLELMLARERLLAERTRQPVSALIVDCDDFKTINDTLGMAEGDRVLREIAGALTRAVRQADLVARVGGDEFLVLMPGARTWEAVRVGERVRSSVRDEVNLGAPTDHPSVSIGVQRLEDLSSVDAVIHATQSGLRTSKRGGKDRVRVAGDAAQDVKQSLPPEPGIQAIAATAIRDLATGAVRMRELRPALNESDTLQLSMQRARYATWDLHWLARAARAVTDPSVLSILSVSPATLLEVGAARVAGCLPDGLPPNRVVLSLEEQFLGGEPASWLERVGALRQLGFAFSLELTDLDRGCLETLVVLRPDFARLDGRLIRGAADQRQTGASVRRFVAVFAALGVTAIAADITSAADADALRDAGVHLGTGALGTPNGTPITGSEPG